MSAANVSTASAPSARGGALGGAAGGTVPPTVASGEDVAVDPAAALRGQIFGVGASLSLALSFLVGGFSLMMGVEELTAVFAAMGTCLVVVVLSFFAELILGPSLERIAIQREEERKEREREEMPSAGGLLFSGGLLTGGAMAGHSGTNGVSVARGANGTSFVPAAGGVVGRMKGRALDITLPEESTVAPTSPSAGNVAGGTVSPPTRAGVPASVSTRPATAPGAPRIQSTAPATAAAVPTGSAAASPGASVSAAGDGEFQDLAALLREASQPSPVPARAR